MSSTLPMLLDRAKFSAEQIGHSLAPDDDWAPVLLMLTAGNELVPVLIPPAGGSEIERSMLWQSVVPSILVTHHAREVVVVQPAWMRRYDGPVDPADPLSVPSNERPLNRPDDRMEVLVLTYVSREHEQQLCADVVRHERRPPRLRWRDGWEFEFGGRVVAGLRRGLSEA